MSTTDHLDMSSGAYEREVARQISNPTTPLVIYHSPCLDGFTAAWACWSAHPDWEFYPGVHGELPPDVTDRDVYLLDFSYGLLEMGKMARDARTLVILDHHISAKERVEAMFETHRATGVFDVKHSGAYLAWRYFHPEETVPALIQYVEDGDLWKFQLPFSKEINAYLFAEEYNNVRWSSLRKKLAGSSTTFFGIKKEGAAILRKHFKDINEICDKLKFRVRIADTEVWAVNLPHSMVSDAGHLLCYDDKTFAAVFHYAAPDWVNVSLRSADDGMDVSEIAVSYGGGGHRNAAAFKIKDINELRVKE